MRRKKYYNINEVRNLNYHKETRQNSIYFVSLKLDFYIDCNDKKLYFSDSSDLPAEEELEKGESKIENCTKKEIAWIEYCYNNKKFISFDDFKKRYRYIKKNKKLLLI